MARRGVLPYLFKQYLLRSRTTTDNLAQMTLVNARTIILFERAYDMTIIFLQTKQCSAFCLCPA